MELINLCHIVYIQNFRIANNFKKVKYLFAGIILAKELLTNCFVIEKSKIHNMLLAKLFSITLVLLALFVT